MIDDMRFGKLVAQHVLSFKVPQEVLLDPSVPGRSRYYALSMGLTNLLLKIGLLVLFVYSMSMEKSYQAKQVPTGSAQYFLDAGMFTDKQAEVRDLYDNGDGLCYNTEPYWYHNR